MNIYKKLDSYFNERYPQFYPNSKHIIETHDLVYSQRLYDEYNYVSEDAGYEYEYYFCKTCSAELKDIIWRDGLGWDPINCNEMVVKRLLE